MELEILRNNWTTTNNGVPLGGEEVERLLAVRPSPAQLRQAARPFYCFLHFGMNTATNREWGQGEEVPMDFTVMNPDSAQWAETVKASGATGIILTCKHHDGFCLWNTAATDFSVARSPFGGDIVAMTAAACRKAGLDFGVYLSPWDMHEPSYATPRYNDFFCAQLRELLTNYGPIFEVWFDGAKGEEAADFAYDWQRYYALVRELQPEANIAVCGPDIRWVGNEAGKTRRSEFSVVPHVLTLAETVERHSQHSEVQQMRRLQSSDEDLGSRAVLARHEALCWYPAEVDVSIRPGWFHHPEEDSAVKSAGELFQIYLDSVGNNCTLLLNVPPAADVRIPPADQAALAGLGKRIQAMTADPIAVAAPGEMRQGWLELDFGGERAPACCILEEDIAKSQRVERFDLYLRLPDGGLSLSRSGTVIGSRKILSLTGEAAVGAVLVIRQSRGAPQIKRMGIYT